MTHTPGPWTILTEDEGFCGRTADGKDLGIVANGQIIAEAFSQVDDKENNVVYAPVEANARLIAAAPELLGALKEIAKAEGAYSMDRLEHASNTIASMEKIAKEAIALVEGEEHE